MARILGCEYSPGGVAGGGTENLIQHLRPWGQRVHRHGIGPGHRKVSQYILEDVKAVCVEAGMLALRRESIEIMHEDFVEAITVVAAKKKGSLDYFA